MSSLIKLSFIQSRLSQYSCRLVAISIFTAGMAMPVWAQPFEPLSEPLPDAPSSVMFSASAASPSASPIDTTKPKLAVATRYATVILPGQTAPRQSVSDKFVSSLFSAVSPAAIIGWTISAGYGQAVDGSPNYERTAKGYGQRVGASAARAGSETIFGAGVIAPLLHQDARYYQMGKGHSFLRRTGYAITRPLITRTDGGRKTLNIWDLGGDFAGAALTPTYYPPLNQSFNEVLQTFGGSVGGDALGFFITEFLGNTLGILHLKPVQ